MDDHSEQFGTLQKLLALKRHETPPPRFFDEMPDRILRKIQSPASSSWERLMDRLFAIRWFQTAATGAMAVIVGTLLIVAVTQPAADTAGPTGPTLFPMPELTESGLDVGHTFPSNMVLRPLVDRQQP